MCSWGFCGHQLSTLQPSLATSLTTHWVHTCAPSLAGHPLHPSHPNKRRHVHLFAESVYGEANHVEVAAPDAGHKGGGGALDAVRASLAKRLPCRRVQPRRRERDFAVIENVNVAGVFQLEGGSFRYS